MMKQTTLSPTTAQETTQVPIQTSETNVEDTCVCTTVAPEEVTTENSGDECRTCPTRNPNLSSGNETKLSLFAPLTIEEIKLTLKVLEVRGYISPESYSLAENRAAHVSLYPVKKSHALDHLDNGGPFPGRFAQVNVARGAITPPDFMEYKIGPLNETFQNIKVEQKLRDGEVHFNRRPFDASEFGSIMRIVSINMGDIKKLLSESFGGATYPRTVGIQFGMLPSVSENDRLSTVFLYLKMSGYLTVRILPITCIVHHPGTNTSQWYASDFYYASQGPFSSFKEMQMLYNNGSLRKVSYPKSYYSDHYNEFGLNLNSSLPQRPLSHLPPPRTYEPKGPRYTIKGHQVEWMGWQFEFSSSPMHGPAIFDVRFKNERIAYEISLQDVTLIYSSQTNGAGPPTLSDTMFLLGSYNTPRFGLDCPDRSSLLHATKYMYGYPQDMKAACVFEADGQKALWRFQSKGLADHHLIIRASMNLGNYDYTLEWKFFLDGSLETLLSASGFLYGAFWDPNDPYLGVDKSATPFGYRISDFQIGPIHNHNYLFKVDLDILGTNNSFQTVNWRAGSALEAFQSRANISEKPGFFYFNNTRYLQQELHEYEKTFITNPLKPKYFTVVNENERNYWGNLRSYRIIPYSKSVEILEEHMMLNAWDDLKYMLAVTKHNDSEQYGTTSWYDLTHPDQAIKGVGRFLNNETIRSEDLVVWVSEKFFHAPSSEDLPMTLSVPSGFMLKPYNYFDRTPVFDVNGHYSKYTEPYVIEECYENFK
ncbi:membrane primary amine oxidase-like [Ruditapes philippinarum]|uniref:membrane primary amine oxidase-like n=1 Tax=Ruditapes philippinarum TaxID=129788 RepID=UPI00295B251E|nr:membrane primary amine oxidase-like [Ruditapes philippinarum]